VQKVFVEVPLLEDCCCKEGLLLRVVHQEVRCHLVVVCVQHAGVIPFLQQQCRVAVQLHACLLIPFLALALFSPGVGPSSQLVPYDQAPLSAGFKLEGCLGSRVALVVVLVLVCTPVGCRAPCSGPILWASQFFWARYWLCYETSYGTLAACGMRDTLAQ
jgi:hypothetical protein